LIHLAGLPASGGKPSLAHCLIWESGGAQAWLRSRLDTTQYRDQFGQ